MARLLCLATILFFLVLSTTSAAEEGSKVSKNTSRSPERHMVEVAGFELEETRDHLTITILILCVIAVKMAFAYFERFASYVPESCFLIMIGVVTGAVLRWGLNISSGEDIWELRPTLFLFILLPPIVFESAIHLCCREFLDVFFPVIFFAVIGTVLNFLVIGVALFYTSVGNAMGDVKMNQTDCFLFSSIIVAVDPVAVLGIFQEIHVDKLLYFYVFGESLFNDAVTIVLYNMMDAFMRIDSIGAVDITLGIVSFFTISFGGALIGIIFGVLSSLITRITSKCRVLEPVIIVVMAYLCYLVGDMVKWSGLIGMICCGMVQAGYAFHNMSHKSVQMTKKAMRIFASFSEAIIFIDLGIALLRINHKWITTFTIWALFYTVVTRFIVTFILSIILNKTGLLIKKISWTEQFVMGYGGLRGAVAFTLVKLIGADILIKSKLDKEMFVSTSIIIIVFTILVMGFTIKPIVKVLKVKLDKAEGLSLFSELGKTACDHFAAGLEAVEGRTGRNALRERLEHFDNHVIRRILQNNPESNDEKILKVYEKVALAIHYASMQPIGSSQSTHYLDKLGSSHLREKLKTTCSQSSLAHTHHDLEAHQFPSLGTVLDVTSHILDSDPHLQKKASSTKPLSPKGNHQGLPLLVKRNRLISRSHHSSSGEFHEVIRRILTSRTQARKSALKEELKSRQGHSHVQPQPDENEDMEISVSFDQEGNSDLDLEYDKNDDVESNAREQESIELPDVSFNLKDDSDEINQTSM